MHANPSHLLNLVILCFLVLVTTQCGDSKKSEDACVAGETIQAEDGCNTCSCNEEGAFECTTEDCAPCALGEEKSGPDGCSLCICDAEGAWSCDSSTCSNCPPALEHDCSALNVYARDKENTLCCTYDSICALPYETPLVFEDLDSCSAVECIPGESQLSEDGCSLCACSGAGISECIELPCPSKCMSGETKDASTWCNSCTCTEDRTWSCSSDECPTECEAGQSKQADDNCNVCACGPDQRWLCSENICEPCEEGSTKIAYDGCNTCVCDASGAWECTGVFVVIPGAEMLGDCPVCIEGATNTAYDECNSCVCDKTEADIFGRWECTKESCGPGLCPEPVQHVCETSPIFALNPHNGNCCPYESSCAIEKDWEQFDTHQACACSLKEFICDLDCSATGYVQDSDGCDTCQCKCVDGEETYDEETCESCACFAGNWTCTIAPCDAVCTPGDLEPANDNCNTCACSDDFEWICTELDCTSPEDNICKPPAPNVCEKKDFWGQTPTGKCCAYDSACSVPLSYPKFPSLEECQTSTE